VCADIKPLETWFQIFDSNKNFSLDLKEYENCLEVTKGVDFIYNMACNMGGMGFIENNKAECMLSVLINTNLLRASLVNKIKKYFFSSSACVYNADKQSNTFIDGLKESDAYPALPEDGYGWEKLFSERMCRHFYEDYGLETRVARYHNVYGPLGTYDGGREKAPAALCRKVAQAKDGDTIEVWGDGKQTRSFLYIDDCLTAVRQLMNSNFGEPVNIGSEEMVTINYLVSLISKISNKKITVKNIEGPTGVKGRKSDNTLYIEKIGSNYVNPLEQGITKLYKWIEDQIKS
jgi:nucleoside-diphosphate-sugar epimerase